MRRQVVKYSIGVLAWIAGISAGFLVVIITASVIARYVFNAPISGSYEIVKAYVLPATVVLGMGWTLRNGAHVSLDVVFRMLPAHVKVMVGYCNGVIASVAILLIALASIWGTRSYYLSGSATNGSAQLPLWIGYIAADVGFASMFLVSLGEILKMRSRESVFLHSIDQDEGR
jgi:TRAP-type C4-dicarboxylate transport system permease small subunit